MSKDLVSTQAVLDSVLSTFQDWIEPDLTDPYVRSLAITVRHLVRHARVRVTAEGQSLWADNRDLHNLLGDLAERIRDLAPTVSVALAAARREPQAYPDVATLSHEADILRRCLSRVIDYLWVNDDVEAHNQVRQYLSRQLRRESIWTTEVFIGARR